jgi:hypothetical protein
MGRKEDEAMRRFRKFGKAASPKRKDRAKAAKAARRPFKHLLANRRTVPLGGQPIMISCFDRSGVMTKPWLEAGYLFYAVDLQHPRAETRKGNLVLVGANLLDWLPPKGDIRFAAFFPPCTDIALSGAQWFKDKGLGALMRSLELFKRSVEIAEMIGCPYLIENPKSVVSTHWRAPDFSFHPCDYGDPWHKETLLWTGGGFKMPEKAPVKPTLGMKLYRLPPGPDRANLRSVTPEGFARAVFRANS